MSRLLADATEMQEQSSIHAVSDSSGTVIEPVADAEVATEEINRETLQRASESDTS